MAMQIMPGKLKENKIIYTDDCDEINVTSTLSSICDGFFVDETVLENGEEITIEIAKVDKIRLLSEKIEKEIFSLIEKMSKTKGDEAKKELASDIRDLVLLRSLIISMFCKDAHDYVLTIS